MFSLHRLVTFVEVGHYSNGHSWSIFLPDFISWFECVGHVDRPILTKQLLVRSCLYICAMSHYLH